MPTRDNRETTAHNADAAAPRWLVRLTLASALIALSALCVMLWAKWAVVVSMTNDVLKWCFG